MFFWSLKFQFCQFCPQILQMLSLWTFYPLMLKKYNSKYTHKKKKKNYYTFSIITFFSIKNKFIKNSTPVPNPQHLALQQYHHPAKCKSPMGATHENPLLSGRWAPPNKPSAKIKLSHHNRTPSKHHWPCWPSNSP